MLLIRRIPLLFIVCLTTNFAAAAVVTLTNGDRITGEIIDSNDASLHLDAEFLGEVDIALAAVAGISSQEPLHVSSKDGQVLVGPITTEGDNIQVHTANSGIVNVPRASLAYVRNEASQRAYEAQLDRLRNPRLTDFWSGYFDTSLALASGNAETTTFSNGAGATRETKRDVIKLYFTSLFAKNSASGESVVTANAVRGGSRYELNGSEKLFTFGFVDLEFDEFQSLDLRNVIGGGFGYHAIDSERMKFNIFGGGSFNQEFFTNGITRRSGEFVAGEDLNYHLNGRVALNQRLAFYPNLSDAGQYRLQFDSGLLTDVFKWMAWNVTLSDRYLSNPVNGRKRNDILLTTGVRLAFGNNDN